MNARDLSELKRRLNPDKRNPTVIRGCYVAADGQVISAFAQPVYQLGQEENEKYMALFKRVLSGGMGQNLLPIAFSAAQVTEGEEHRLLSDLRESALTDEEAVSAFFARVTAWLQAEHAAQDTQSVNEAQADCNHLILLLHDGYDVPFRDSNGEIDRERSAEAFHYILCCVCPVKQTRPALSYNAASSDFHSRLCDWVVGSPELGFLFPAFEERAADINAALAYTRDLTDPHEGFLKAVFGAEPPMPAAEQTETFQTILSESLAEECSLEVVQTVHENVRALIEEQRANRAAEAPRLTHQDVRGMLEECGVSQARADAFEQQYAQAFGDYVELPAVNVAPPKQFKVETPSVSIRVAPDRSDLIETRVIDGKRYILVLADGEVEVNGVNVQF